VNKYIYIISIFILGCNTSPINESHDSSVDSGNNTEDSDIDSNTDGDNDGDTETNSSSDSDSDSDTFADTDFDSDSEEVDAGAEDTNTETDIDSETETESETESETVSDTETDTDSETETETITDTETETETVTDTETETDTGDEICDPVCMIDGCPINEWCNTGNGCCMPFICEENEIIINNWCWLRCPLGQTWNSSSSTCTGIPMLYQYGAASTACHEGVAGIKYAPVTLDQYRELLGNCVWEDPNFICDKCTTSETCPEDLYGWLDGVWTGTPITWGPSGYAYMADLENGKIYKKDRLIGYNMLCNRLALQTY